MEKYGILLLIIIYAIALGITGVLFYPDEIEMKTTTFGIGDDTFTERDTVWQQLSASSKFMSGMLGMTFPGIPAEVNAVLFIPYIILIVYFIYLNLPKTAIGGTPEP
jgi:hypothetical protein